jgi:hypothetical protein
MPNSKSVVKALPSQMTVLPNGNVGIGTTNPLSVLHINGRMLTNQPHCDVSSPNTAASGEIYVFATVHRNNGNHYNASTGRFTCPITGIYLVTFQIRRDNIPNGGYNHAFVYLNGSSLPRISSLTNNSGALFVTINASGTLLVSANDIIDIRAGGTYGTVETSQSGMTVYFLG